MAQVIVEYGPAVVNRSGGVAPVYAGKQVNAEEVTTSGTAASTTATASQGDFVSILNNGSGLVWGSFESTAAVGTDFTIGPGERRDFGPLAEGDAVSLIDDS